VTFTPPASVPHVSPEPVWWRCECGCPLYDHAASRVVSQSGLTYTVCKRGHCVGYLSETGERFENGELTARSPQP
jgi:hypothetical protein